MELKIGGIYTEIENEFFYIIMEERSRNYYVLMYKEECSSKEECIEFVKYFSTNTDIINNVRFCHIKKQGDILLNDIDGYLGQIPEDLFSELMDELKRQIWYDQY